MLDDFVKVSNALVTPMVAIFGTIIAWQQARTNRQRLVLDRYDRRLSIYEEVKQILTVVTGSTKPTLEDLLKFRRSVAEADFLFGPEVPEYLDEIYKRGITLRRWNEEYRDYTQSKPHGYDHAKVVDGMDAEVRWFSDQFDRAHAVFKTYLDVSR